MSARAIAILGKKKSAERRANLKIKSECPALQYGYQKMQNFTLNPNPKAKLKKMHAKKLFSKNCFFASFLQKTFYWCNFSQFHLQIWSKHKILCFWYPYWPIWGKKVLGCMLKKIFCVKIGQNGSQKAQNFILIPNLKMKLRKNGKVEVDFIKILKKQLLMEGHYSPGAHFPFT